MITDVNKNKWQKKPVRIDAVLWSGNELVGGAPDWIVEAMNKGYQDNGFIIRMGDHIDINTLEGIHRADAGDWILRGVKGELYPCKPDIFDLTYEKVCPAYITDGKDGD